MKPGPAPTALGRAAAAWAAAKRTRAGRLRIRYREAGAGPAIVLVHGLGVSADYWWRVAPRLAAEGFQVLAPDLPGFGRSAAPRPAIGIDAQAASLRCWADALDMPPAVYVGHSLSCQTVLALAVRSPDVVRGLVLAAPTGDGVAARRLLRQAVGLARDVPRESLLLAALVAQAYLRAGPIRVLRTWRHGADHDPLELLADVHAPGIVVVGDEDPVVDVEFALAVSRRLEPGRLVLVPNAAHAVVFDPTGAFARAIADFARSLP